jgi:dipeptidyl aminopeptidase/acylaminoacyl peptidase
MKITLHKRFLVALGAMVAVSLAVVAGVPGASGTFPGRNGKIVVTDAHRFYLVSPNGTGLRDLRTPFNFHGDPAWSPDGKTIAFAATRECCVDYTGLAVINANGTGVRELIKGSRPGGFASCCPSWSPDGRRLIYRNDEGDEGTGIYVVDPKRPKINPKNRYVPVGKRVFLVSLDFEINQVRWLSDTEIVLRLHHNGAKVSYVVRFDGYGRRKVNLPWPIGELSPDHHLVSYLRWKNNGVYKSEWTRGAQSDIFIANADGSHARKLVGGPEDEDTPVWSPDGKKIAYLQVADLWVVNVDGRGKKRILSGAGGSDFTALDWQPLA